MSDALKPRCVTAAEAARYVSLTPGAYRAAVKRGVFPANIPGTNRYDLKAIDRALDRIAGIDAPAAAPELTPLEKWRASREGRSETHPDR